MSYIIPGPVTREAFHVTTSAPLVVVSGDIVALDTQVHDPDGLWDAVAYRFVAAADGLWEFHLFGTVFTSGSIRLYLNGAAVSVGGSTPSLFQTSREHVHTLRLTVGDIVTVHANSGGTISAIAFTGFRIG